MKFWLLVLLLNLLIPMAMLSGGVLYLMKPPQRTVWMYGYRTKRSMSSQETWEFAQEHCGKIYCRFGIGMLVGAVVSLLFVWGKNRATVGLTGTVIGTVEGLIMLYTLLPTERALKQRFGI